MTDNKYRIHGAITLSVRFSPWIPLTCSIKERMETKKRATIVNLFYHFTDLAAIQVAARNLWYSEFTDDSKFQFHTNLEWTRVYFVKQRPPRVDDLDVLGRLTPSKYGNQEFTKRTHLNTQLERTNLNTPT
jgi:hypothetical protein